jgi:hypothetical protein
MRCDTLGWLSRSSRAAAWKLLAADDALEGFQLGERDVHDRFANDNTPKTIFGYVWRSAKLTVLEGFAS